MTGINRKDKTQLVKGKVEKTVEKSTKSSVLQKKTAEKAPAPVSKALKKPTAKTENTASVKQTVKKSPVVKQEPALKKNTDKKIAAKEIPAVKKIADKKVPAKEIPEKKTRKKIAPQPDEKPIEKKAEKKTVEISVKKVIETVKVRSVSILQKSAGKTVSKQTALPVKSIGSIKKTTPKPTKDSDDFLHMTEEERRRKIKELFPDEGDEAAPKKKTSKKVSEKVKEPEEPEMDEETLRKIKEAAEEAAAEAEGETEELSEEIIDDQEAYKNMEEVDISDIDEDKLLEEVKKEKLGKLVVAAPGVSKNDTMKVYMQDIGQISLVSKTEEVELAAKIHGEDTGAHDTARATLIQANLRLVVKIAHDFKGLGLPLLDLISEGNIGLMRAVEKFDPAKGAKFSSYAAWWIKQSMRRALANQSRTIRIPVQSAGKINKIKCVKMKLTEKLGREPTDAEIAESLKFSERTVNGLRLADLKTFSLHDPIQQGEDGEFQDIIPDRGAMTPDRILGDVESIARLMELLRDLDERERMILQMRFGLDNNRPRTLEEVSQEIGRTRERVRQIQNQALSKLKALLADEADFTSD